MSHKKSDSPKSSRRTRHASVRPVKHITGKKVMNVLNAESLFSGSPQLDFSAVRQAVVDTEDFPTFTPDDIRKLNGQTFAIDTENTGLYWYKDRPLGIGIYCPGVIEGYMPVRDPSILRDFQAEMYKLDSSTRMIAHNMKYDQHFMGLVPARLQCQQRDTVLMDHAIDSRPAKVQGGHSKRLDVLELRHLGTKSKLAFSDPLDKTKLENYPPGMVAPYCINDARVTYEIHNKMEPELTRLGLQSLIEKDMDYNKVLWQIERNGMAVDDETCYNAIASVKADQDRQQAELFDIIGECNWRSGSVLSRKLYDEYPWPRPVNPFLDEDGVDRSRFAQRGKYNSNLTDTTILMEKAQHPLAGLISSLRECDKIIDYYNGFLFFRDSNGVHTNFNQAGTRTRRLSSSDPNLQNLASDVRNRQTHSTLDPSLFTRTAAYNPRLALVARPGTKLVSIDYKQMEMRMFGVIAGEEEMIQALRDGTDIHTAVATMVWGIADKVRREWAKNIGFGLIYAMSTGALQFRLGMTRDEANKVADDYNKRFPRIQPWLRETIKECDKFGFVRYSSGAIWREDEPINFYKGANAVIQGACGDLMSIAVIRCQDWLNSIGWGQIVNIVHDEIDFELPEDKLHIAIPALSNLMQVSDLLNIPFFTDAKVGPNFGDMHEWSLN